MDDDYGCPLGHCWEVTSGDYVECVECGTEGRVIVLGELE